MSKRPHEMELETRFNGGNTCLTDQTGRIVAYVRDRDDETFFKAAPDMARELMGAVRSFRQGYRITEAEIRGMESALRKAGVIP